MTSANAFTSSRSGRSKTAPLDLDAFERRCLEDDDLDPDVAARRLAKAALARQYRDSAGQQLALVKRQKVADVEEYEAETRAAKEKYEAETRAAKEKYEADGSAENARGKFLSAGLALQ